MAGLTSGLPVGVFCAVLQRLNERAIECLARAANAERRAQETTDPVLKSDYTDTAKRWRGLAESYQFIERVESFLAETKTIGSMAWK